MEVENATLWHQGRKCNIKVKNNLIKCNFMIENAIKVENATSREKILHQCVSFSAKKNRYKDKIQRWLKLIWRSPELNQVRSNFSSKICFTLIFVLHPRLLKHLIASNYGEKKFQSCQVKAGLSKNGGENNSWHYITIIIWQNCFRPLRNSHNPNKYFPCCYSLFFIICYGQCALSGVNL